MLSFYFYLFYSIYTKLRFRNKIANIHTWIYTEYILIVIYKYISIYMYKKLSEQLML